MPSSVLFRAARGALLPFRLLVRFFRLLLLAIAGAGAAPPRPFRHVDEVVLVDERGDRAE